MKNLKETLRQKKKQIPRWAFTVLISCVMLSVAGTILVFVWYYQQNNLDSLNNKIEDLNKSISAKVTIPKDNLIRKLSVIQKNIDTLKVEEDTKRQLSKQIAELEQEIINLPKNISSSERLALDKDLLVLKKEVIKEQNGVVGTVLQAISALFFFSTVVLSALSFKSSDDKQISERFSQAVELLSDQSDKTEMRLGGIYALEQIAKSSVKDHWVVMEVLTSFIRNRAGSEDKSQQYTLEIQSALTVIGRRDYWKESEEQKLNLRKLILVEVDLRKAKLRNVDFEETNLSKAHFEEANLRGVSFKDAILIGAHLKRADLEGACFDNADLRDAGGLEEIIGKPDLSKARGRKRDKLLE